MKKPQEVKFCLQILSGGEQGVDGYKFHLRESSLLRSCLVGAVGNSLSVEVCQHLLVRCRVSSGMESSGVG